MTSLLTAGTSASSAICAVAATLTRDQLKPALGWNAPPRAGEPLAAIWTLLIPLGRLRQNTGEAGRGCGRFGSSELCQTIGACCRSSPRVAGRRRLFRSEFGTLGLCCFGKKGVKTLTQSRFTHLTSIACLAARSYQHILVRLLPIERLCAGAVALLHFAGKSEIGQRPRDPRSYIITGKPWLGASAKRTLRGTTVRNLFAEILD